MSSPPSTHPESIHLTAVVVRLQQAERSKRLCSGKLHIGPHRHALICINGTLRQEFQNVVELTLSTRITLHYKVSSWPLRKTVQMDTANLFAGFSASQAQGRPEMASSLLAAYRSFRTDIELPVLQDGIQVVFSCQSALTALTIPKNPDNDAPTTPTSRTLTPTTDPILEDCPQFRVLVIGESGVGKSSLIRSAFGIDKAHCSDYVRGEADIETGLHSVVNKRFILHDSVGFEAGDNVKYDKVKNFIRSRRRCEPKDRLHAVWFCLPVPRAGGRLLEASVEDFFNTKKETMGTDIPIIVVYTKIDEFVDDRMLNLAASGGQPGEENPTDVAFKKACSDVEKSHEEINRFAREYLPHVVVSTKENYEHTLQKLVGLTSRQVVVHDAAGAETPSGVITLIAAQRIDPILKIQGTIDIGRQKYWKALGSSAAFEGFSIWNCLSVIHTDIVAIWNFNDPDQHLSEKKFKELIVNMAEQLECPVSNPAQKILALSGGSLVAIVSAVLASAANPAAPIVLPIIAGLAVTAWLYGVYRNAKNVQQLFIAYIVDLTHVLETLAILTARNHKKLTRRIIKRACQTYYESGLMTQAHSNIQKYRKLDGRDAALEMIEDLIKPERYGDVNLRNYYAGIGNLDLAEFHLDQEEEW